MNVILKIHNENNRTDSCCLKKKKEEEVAKAKMQETKSSSHREVGNLIYRLLIWSEDRELSEPFG